MSRSTAALVDSESAPASLWHTVASTFQKYPVFGIPKRGPLDFGSQTDVQMFDVVALLCRVQISEVTNHESEIGTDA